MTFNPAFLPGRTYKAYKFGVGAWSLVVQTAIEEGVRDIDCLTDIMFYLHHPELRGRPLESGETGMIDQWKHFRETIRPLAYWDPVKKETITGQRSTASDTRIWTWDKVQELRSGSTSQMRTWRSRNGHLIDGRSSGMDMWSWHEAARMGAFDPPFRGGVFVAS